MAYCLAEGVVVAGVLLSFQFYRDFLCVILFSLIVFLVITARGSDGGVVYSVIAARY